MGNAEFVWSVSDNWSILGMELCKVIWLLEGQELVDLPEVGQACEEWTGVFGKGM